MALIPGIVLTIALSIYLMFQANALRAQTARTKKTTAEMEEQTARMKETMADLLGNQRLRERQR